MDEEKTIKQFHELSDTAKAEPSDFISFLHKKYKKKNSKSNFTTSKLTFYGVFKDREEMKDSSNWVREVRKKHWGADE